MALYKCPKCKQERKIYKISMKIIDGKIVEPEALCSCGEYMKDTTPKPDVIRTNVIRNE